MDGRTNGHLTRRYQNVNIALLQSKIFLDVGILIHEEYWIVICEYMMDYDKIIEDNPKLRRWQVIETAKTLSSF